MKKLVVSTLLLALGAVPTALFAARNDAYGHTFYTVRPQFQSEMPEKISGVRHLAKRRMDGMWGGAYVQAVPFGGRSSKSTALGRYFSPSPQDSLFVSQTGVGTAGDIAARLSGVDINAGNFNIAYETSFSSTISFRPRQTVVGAGFEWRQYLGFWNDDHADSRWWFSLAGPVERVENDMRLSETGGGVGDQDAGTAANMTQAFAGTVGYLLSEGGAVTMNYGRIDGKQRKTGFADLEFKLGYDYVLEDIAYLTGYLGFVAPTGNRPQGVYMFEPIVGNNHHWGIMTGGYLGFDFWNCGNHELYFEVAANTRYLFQNTQTRSFDLVNRPWSRYMLAYEDAADAAAGLRTPGINLFTRDVRVNPHFQFNMTAALVYNHCGFTGELGYNFWARQAESVKLADPFPADIAIAGVGIAGLTNLLSNIAISNTASNIAYASTAGNVLETDIDYLSMSHPAALSHIVYGSLGYNWDWCWPIYLGVGGSYEFSTNNVALTRWLAWGKIAISL